MEPNQRKTQAVCRGETPRFRVLLSEQELRVFHEYAVDILSHPQVQGMQQYIQHGSVNCFEHSQAVALLSLWLCSRLPLSADERSVVRGALLHDFFLYDWHEKQDIPGLHGLTHPQTALHNARKYFSLNPREENIILRHMWPLTWPAPKYKEAFIVCLADKYCSLWETLFCRKQKAE